MLPRKLLNEANLCLKNIHPWIQRDGLGVEVLAASPDDLSLIPSMHVIEEENRF